jgi:hypothetical protein
MKKLLKRMRLRLLAAAVMLLALAMPGCKGGPAEELTPDYIRSGPLTFYLKIDGGLYTANDAWHFVYLPDGRAYLTILRFPHSDEREIELTKEQLDELREALIRERFFDLPGELGETETDKGLRGMRITIGGFIHSVDNLEIDCTDMGPKQLDEYRRALRVWGVVREWFDAPSIVSYKEQDRKCLGEE